MIPTRSDTRVYCIVRALSRDFAIVLSVLLASLLPAGCSSQRSVAQDPTAIATHDGGTAVDGHIQADSLVVSASPDTLPDVRAPWWPTPPAGEASIADLEALYQQALQYTADRRLDLAEDVLLVLQDLCLGPLPDGADSLYTTTQSSLQRRIHLLGGVLAEERAFAQQPADQDSLLTVAYERLRRLDFPDSLVPATGTELPPFAADLLTIENAAVKKWEDHFTGRGRPYFARWLQRKTAVDSLVTTILGEYDLPRELIYLAMIESGLSSRARSSVGAVGPWQFMPGTAKAFDLRRDWWIDERRDFELSTRAAARYLSQLYQRFGNWALVLAAYNSGENRVARQVRFKGHDDYWRMHLPRQTTDYVPKFIAATRIGEHPERYGFEVTPAPPLVYDTLSVDDATDIALIAECAGTTKHDLVLLNPALLRGATPPDSRGYAVRVPAGSGVRAAAALRRIPADKRLTWRRHRVKRGDTLSQIAAAHGTSVADIARLNKLDNRHLIRPGDQLLIPMPADLAARAKKRTTDKGYYVPPDGYVRVSYKVRQGDTLGGIARKLGVSLKHLRKVNAIYRSHLIHPGQRIYAYRPQNG
jgi:membrane-bound lytic murein transglycosylase D